jgi:GNAT superfamily N-acetyltransferase
MNAQPRAAALALAPRFAWRGRAVDAALRAEARRRCATTACLQLTAGNAPAKTLYRHVSFWPAHEYGYRARAGEQH